MAQPAILIPGGLGRIHPQLEVALKSIGTAVQALQQSASAPGAGSSAGGLTAQLAVLRQQVDALQAQLAASSSGEDFVFFCA